MKEVGPYVYRSAAMKKDVIFSSEDVSYKSLASTKYDPVATKLLCPNCNEADKVYYLLLLLLIPLLFFFCFFSFISNNITSILVSL